MYTNALLVLASVGLSGGVPQPSTASISIGGPGSCSSEGHDDPGLLSDGETAASANYVFTLDIATAQLTLEVTNTSPVVLGAPNPLLTDVFFNAPAAITDMVLVAQASSGGVDPDYALVFDAQPGSGMDPNTTGRFGTFGAGLSDQGSIHGAIANPAADTYTVDDVALSPVTFTFELAGDLTGLTAASFTELLSLIPPGSKPSRAVGKFQAGGDQDASAFLNEGKPCVEGSAKDLGEGCGGTLSVSVPIPGGPSTVSYEGSIPNGMLVVFYSLPGGTPFQFKGCTVFLANPPVLLGTFPTDANGDFEQTFIVPAHHDCGDQAVFQAFALPGGGRGGLEISNGVLITMGS